MLGNASTARGRPRQSPTHSLIPAADLPTKPDALARPGRTWHMAIARLGCAQSAGCVLHWNRPIVPPASGGAGESLHLDTQSRHDCGKLLVHNAFVVAIDEGSGHARLGAGVLGAALARRAGLPKRLFSANETDRLPPMLQ